MENPQIVNVFSKSPETEKFRVKKKSRFSWGSRKNFQYKFFNYLMTNNDVGLSEIVQQFFHGLDFQSLLHCRLVCKAWYRFLNQFPSFWMDSLTEAREKFLYEPRNYMKRFHKPSYAIVDEECGKWEALSNYVGKNGTVGDMIIMISAIQRAFKYSNDKGRRQPLLPYAPLRVCTTQKSFNLLKVIVESNITSNEEIERFSGDLLLWAARIDGMEIMDYILPLVQHKYQVDPQADLLMWMFDDPMNWNDDPISWAIYHQDLKKLKALIPLQAANKEFWNRNYSDPRSPTPLEMAIQTNRMDIIKEIAKLTDVDRSWVLNPGYSYLHMAVFTKRDDIYDFIYSLAENKTPTDKEGLTPIDWKIKLLKEGEILEKNLKKKKKKKSKKKTVSKASDLST